MERTRRIVTSGRYNHIQRYEPLGVNYMAKRILDDRQLVEMLIIHLSSVGNESVFVVLSSPTSIVSTVLRKN
jgi:hypothetical protein